MSHYDTHPNLTKYVAAMNFWAAHVKEPAIELRNFTEANRRSVREQLDCDLSPENLCCDGELRGAALAKKLVYLRSVERELETL
jgi:hypothetical protein